MQPWASLIMSGTKRFETRHWYTSHRGIIAIHSGKSREFIDYVDGPLLDLLPETLPLGCVLGTANLVGCHRMTTDIIQKVGFTERALGNWEIGRFAWELSELELFDDPIPARGMQGIWEWEPQP